MEILDTEIELTGKSIIGYSRANSTGAVLYGREATTGEQLDPPYYSASNGDLQQAVSLATEAFPTYRALSRKNRAEFLRAIAANIEGLGDQLIKRDMQESALPEARARNERDRTCFQLRFFAAIVEEGSWVDARIDTADPNRKPAPRPDVRSMLRPLGPVGIFCASNFPLAFSVAGGDTASALAGGNPVVVNAHFSHPGTAELCGAAIRDAAQKTGMPEGVFSLLFSAGHEIGQALVAHPDIKACGFTGSRRGGLALLKIAQSRPEPIPFFAEMSSVNPVFILPNALKERSDKIASAFHTSLVMGVGQFCTNPGIALLPRDNRGDSFVKAATEKIKSGQPGVMLNAGIFDNYRSLVAARSTDSRLRTICYTTSGQGAAPALFEVSTQAFIKTPELQEEVFGPASLVVRYNEPEELIDVARSLEGNLTAAIHWAAGDEALRDRLAAELESKVGRIIYNGFGTGLEVCQAQVHGGPFPATSDARTTSVGGRAIERFTHLVCWQDAPEASLPEELRNGNPAGIMRMIDGNRTRDAVL